MHARADKSGNAFFSRQNAVVGIRPVFGIYQRRILSARIIIDERNVLGQVGKTREIFHLFGRFRQRTEIKPAFVRIRDQFGFLVTVLVGTSENVNTSEHLAFRNKIRNTDVHAAFQRIPLRETQPVGMSKHSVSKTYIVSIATYS